MMLNNFLQATDPRAEIIPGAGEVSGDAAVGGFNIFDVFSNFIGYGDLTAAFGVLKILSLVWIIFAVVAYIVSIVLLALYVYASIQKKNFEDLQTQVLRDGERAFLAQFGPGGKDQRLNDVLFHSESDSPNDWRLAIIEADIILDDILKKHGYAGNSLGERLKSISPQQLSSLNDAWEAHKIRNRIAHDGADFILTKRLVQETIARYQRVFAEFGIR